MLLFIHILDCMMFSYQQGGVGERRWARWGWRDKWRSWWGRRRKRGLGSCRRWGHAMLSWPLPYLTRPASSSGLSPPCKTSLTSTPPLTMMWVHAPRGRATKVHGLRPPGRVWACGKLLMCLPDLVFTFYMWTVVMSTIMSLHKFTWYMKFLTSG